MRVGPDWEQVNPDTDALLKQLRGERVYSSALPAMQALNPRVNELFLQYVRLQGYRAIVDSRHLMRDGQ